MSHSLSVNKQTKKLDSGLGERRNLCKSIRISDCNVSQHFTIDLYISLFEAKDELAVRQAINAGSRIDSDDPQAAEITFFDAAIAESII